MPALTAIANRTPQADAARAATSAIANRTTQTDAARAATSAIANRVPTGLPVIHCAAGLVRRERGVPLTP
jgi:hypothetical protein